MRHLRYQPIAVTLATTAVTALMLTACDNAPEGPPSVTVDRTPCAGCGMLVSDTRYVAAYRSTNDVRIFDDLHCLLEELSGVADAPVAETIWLRDAAGDQWLSAAAATVVRSPAIRSPMGGGMLAFSTPETAQHHGATLASAQLTSFAEIRRDWDRLARQGGRR